MVLRLSQREFLKEPTAPCILIKKRYEYKDDEIGINKNFGCLKDPKSIRNQQANNCMKRPSQANERRKVEQNAFLFGNKFG
jgi:hypothetical protein